MASRDSPAVWWPARGTGLARPGGAPSIRAMRKTLIPPPALGEDCGALALISLANAQGWTADRPGVALDMVSLWRVGRAPYPGFHGPRLPIAIDASRSRSLRGRWRHSRHAAGCRAAGCRGRYRCCWLRGLRVTLLSRGSSGLHCPLERGRMPACVAPSYHQILKPRPWRALAFPYVRGQLSWRAARLPSRGPRSAAGRLLRSASVVVTRFVRTGAPPPVCWLLHSCCAPGTNECLRRSSRAQTSKNANFWESPHRRREVRLPTTTRAPRPPRSPRSWTASARVGGGGVTQAFLIEYDARTALGEENRARPCLERALTCA